MNVLFVCSRNQWRSPTAEKIFNKKKGINSKSAGTEPSARIKLNSQHLEWADIIFVMERKHKERIFQKYGEIVSNKHIEILDIEDNFKYMDTELIEILELSVNPILERYA
ncbi:MAG: protein tyrosine phosphatase [Saprospiraceae bacterium]|jgi:predicted protein tyrosine phosphatase|nr:protein tyrosine phosphatase [Saprospiraceae bacterium]